MKKYILLLLIPFFMGCEKDTIGRNNPYLPDYSVNINVNLNLPTFSNLQFPGNGVLINTAGVGIRGVFVFNTGTGYTAFDAACPNQVLSDCSSMTLNGINAKCSCDDAEYSLYTGLSEGKNYPMKSYRTEVNGNIIRVYN
ncbi:MAG: nitrite reductase/ring-hydroxylating ferredoxin subunit [Flavobacterium sp.]|jgi:nitrite reductase/ring-hydroxylating ferredoxin subunit